MIEIDRIYNEDCLEGMKRIDDQSIDCIITDLPYGVLNKQSSGGGLGHHHTLRRVVGSVHPHHKANLTYRIIRTGYVYGKADDF